MRFFCLFDQEIKAGSATTEPILEKSRSLLNFFKIEFGTWSSLLIYYTVFNKQGGIRSVLKRWDSTTLNFDFKDQMIYYFDCPN